ncbi:hypothetical protein [Mycobacterium asiaticum]|uniref:Uncharacterized protein n=1 Tax=Mycobacterium asiaticum TaxID=1790 RepID=A0A1A3IFG4_MYCAS|nr:hypothetical protein [Mycobacterium asiaticum]OBI94020.1 hypothetical protein A5661_23625 [Mycobacterium asiaticum]OBJ58436.1 hypothetical protein A9W94_16485 [Mycobacterium asiaticum]OBJ82256.1 hypothetical protein A5640_21365 [Mycobacterium asiaticum]ORA16703.1 hypothetical protein BST16_05810 [Mycobacterium asiaticum DSM 44297]
MLQTIRRVLSYQLTAGRLLAIGIVIGVPYLLVGTVWSNTHTEHLRELHGADLAVSYLGSIVSWPVLLFSNVCMT